MTKKIQRLAALLYESSQTDSAFISARQLFPDWNRGGEDTDSAVEHILGDILRRIPEGLSEQERDALTDELSSMIHAGLT